MARNVNEIIESLPATRRRKIEKTTKHLKQQYDFSKGKRGRITPPEPELKGKARITIRLDEDLIDHFLKEADASGGATGYQTLINEALRQHVEGKAPKFEETLRRIVREEVKAAS